MRFHKGNKIKYGQDFKYYVGIPHGIDFELHGNKEKFMLCAPGFGLHPDYGNGALYPYDLTEEQIKDFETEISTNPRA